MPVLQRVAVPALDAMQMRGIVPMAVSAAGHVAFVALGDTGNRAIIVDSAGATRRSAPIEGLMVVSGFEKLQRRTLAGRTDWAMASSPPSTQAQEN
jgi:hypothetical protein